MASIRCGMRELVILPHDGGIGGELRIKGPGVGLGVPHACGFPLFDEFQHDEGGRGQRCPGTPIALTRPGTAIPPC